jgi:hypothetical protein
MGIKSKLVDLYYDTKNFFINVWLYRKTLAKDRHWDYVYILYMLKRKLELTRDVILKDEYTCSERTTQDLRYINICIKLIDYLENSYYLSERVRYYNFDINWEDIKYKYGRIQLCKSTEIIVTLDKSDEYIKKYKHVYKEVLKNYPEEKHDTHFIMLYMDDALEDKAYKLLFNILYNKMRFWWR